MIGSPASDRRRTAGSDGDARLIALIDATMAEAARRAGSHLACRIGCTECCMGPFPITVLDARRLQVGLALVARREPARAEAIRSRARTAVAQMRPDFPGDPHTGILSEDEAAEAAFSTRHEHVPCPALDPASGRCELYQWRPISCRTFGPPVLIGDEKLPPCRLCFTGASSADIEAARVPIDPEGLEDRLLERYAARGLAGETVVAFALL
jgi:Fe-S-cluster containining protein